MADLAVLVVSHNAAQWLERCLRSVYEHAGGARLELVVVDSGSTDGSAELIEREFPEVLLLRGANRGFAAANNVGVCAVTAPFVLFLNPDTEIIEGELGELLALLRSRPCVGLVGCRQVGADGGLLPTIRRFPTAARYLCGAIGSERWPILGARLGERVLAAAAYERETRCDWTVGSFMLARRAAILAAGGMDERYFLYCEEPDLCLRLRRLGWEVRHLPAMTIVHHAGKAGRNELLVAQDAYARAQYLLKNMGPVQRRLALLALVLNHLLRAGWVCRGQDLRRSRRACARRAISTLLGGVPPPFEAAASRCAESAPASRCAESAPVSRCAESAPASRCAESAPASPGADARAADARAAEVGT